MANNFNRKKDFFGNKNFSNNQQLSNASDDVNLKDGYLNTKINQHNLSLIKSCKKLSVVYIVLWSILFVFVISVSISLISLSIHDKDYYALFTSLLAFGLILGFILFVLGIIIINKTLSLKRYYCNYVSTGLFVWFWVGLYLFGFFSFVGSFLVISNCNKIKNLNFKDLESINKSEYSNTSLENKQNNLFLLKACTWASSFYILLWLSLIIFIIVVVTPITSCDASGYYDYYIYMFNTIGIGCGCFGIVLFILGVFLAGVNISLSNYFYPKGSALYIVFIIGTFFCGITSFFGSMIAISECNRIKKQYFSKQSINNEQIVNDNLKKDIRMKKSLKISFVVFGSVAAIIGAGLVGGTYGSYSTYQLLSFMQNTVSRDNQLLSLGYNLTNDNVNYLNSLLYNYSFGEYVDGYSTTSADGLNGFFNSYNTILGWITNSEKNGIVDYLTNELSTSSASDSSSDSSSSSDDTSSLVSQTISDFNNLESQISSNGFPNSSAIENDLQSIIDSYNYNYKDDGIAQNLSNALDAYNNEISGLLTIISKIDSDLEQLINNKTIDLSSTSSMNSTTKQYFLNYINLLGTDSAKAVNVNPSCFVAMFNTTDAITAFDNNDAIGLNDLSNYLQTDSSQTFFDSIFTLYQFAKNSFADSYIGFSMGQISPDGWNKNIANLSDFQKTNLNNILQSQKSIFYQAYPTWDGTWKNVANSANLSDDEAYDIYYLQDSIYHLNCNYNADQSGVVAGSVLLSIGIIILIISVVFLVKIKKFKKEEKIEIQ